MISTKSGNTVSILKLQILRAGPELKCPVCLCCLSLSMVSSLVVLPKSRNSLSFQMTPFLMASSVGKIILKVIPFSVRASDSRRITFPSKSRLLISIPVSPRSFTCLSLPIPTVKAIAQRPHRTLAPFLFPFILSYDEREGAVVQREVRKCSVHSSSHLPKSCAH